MVEESIVEILRVDSMAVSNVDAFHARVIDCRVPGRVSDETGFVYTIGTCATAHTVKTIMARANKKRKVDTVAQAQAAQEAAADLESTAEEEKPRTLTIYRVVRELSIEGQLKSRSCRR